MHRKSNAESISAKNQQKKLHLGAVFTKIIDLMDVTVWELDPSFTITSCNQKALATYGEDIVGRYCYSVTKNRESVCQNCPVKKVYNTLKPHRAVQSHLDNKGKRIVVDHLATPIFEENGRLVGVLAQLVDITETKKYEKNLLQRKAKQKKIAREKTAALVKSEHKFALAFDASPDAININRLEDGLYVEVNKGFTNLTGFTSEDVIGKTSLEIGIWYDPADRERLVKRLKKDGYCENLEAVFRHKNGTLTTALMSARIVSINEESHIISITRDISKLKDMESEIRAQKMLFETMFNAIEDGIVITNAEDKIQLANDGMSKTFGYYREELLGLTIDVLSADYDRQRQSGFIFSDNDIGSANEKFVQIYKHKNGKEFPAATFTAQLRNRDGQWIGNLSIMRDITKQLVMERQLRQAQKMDAVGSLTGGVAHDFNNMVGVILGFTEMALDRLPAEDETHEDLLKIQEAAERSSHIIQQLMAFSRQQTIDPENLDLNSTLESMLEMLRRLIGEDIHLDWLPHPFPLSIKMDKSQVDQILANLCVNAKDAIESDGTITIETGNVVLDESYCSLHNGCQVGEYALLTVSDNGHGIKQEDLDRVYEPFFTTKKLGHGTGLGLATVYGIMKQNNGFIDIESESGKGTSVKVYFPFCHEAAKPTKPTKPTEIRSRKQSIKHGKEKILLVEDDAAFQVMVETMLIHLGYTVFSADTPQQAIRLAEEKDQEIDLLFTDVVMPEMNGKELAKRLQKMFPKVKTIYMSGYATDVIVEKGVLHEDVHFIQKPFSRMVLAKMIREALEE